MAVNVNEYDFHGYATKNDLQCSDGRIIRRDAFKHCDGITVPLVWNHDHNDPYRIIGNALLENRNDGVYAYGKFNDTDLGKTAKLYVQHRDITQLSIYANQLKQQGPNVLHGSIREVSLVMAGANPGAYIADVIKHSADGEPVVVEDEACIFTGEDIEIYHAEGEAEMADVENTVAHAESENEEGGGKTIQDVLDTMNDEQRDVVSYLVAKALEEDADDDEDEEDDSEGGEESMKHNVFDQEEKQQGNFLSHADQEAIISLAKQSNVGSLKQAVKIYAEEKGILQHSDDNVGVFEDYGVLFPELELLKKGEPDTIYKNDQSWVGAALSKIHKSPFSRIRTRHADARLAELKAKGYQKKGDEKTVMGQIKMISRETTPQTIYIKDGLHRDDIIDITDFDIVAYQWKMMRGVLNETMILSAMVGDGREIGDPDKISEEHIRPIWKDDEEYTIHRDVDIEAMKTKLQGTNTGANFGENYIYAEAMIEAALYSREKFKGTGTPDFYCTPHLVNVMLLARDMNGRRIYDSKAELAKALNCNSIVEVEQFEGLTRTTEDGKQKKLLGLFVNLNDYTFGATRGGEITKFEDFDMDFNLQKFMLETRLSGSLYKLKSAIALEEPVADVAG
ncbi:HK97 family phage prohead protease [Fibrobacter sp.]|uniref:HK97 family phage prohead protease n=1 Tax=Fibrobacter sp. TaxID=35828 RepID=UPI00388EB4B7